MRLMVILPLVSDKYNEETQKECTYYAAPGTEIGTCNLDYGPESVEGEYDEALSVPNLLEKAEEAQRMGYDGVISDCFGDPGLKPAREILDIPVVGAAESTMMFAATLARKFSVVTVLPTVVPMIENIAIGLGLERKLASIRYINIPVLDLVDKEKMENALFDEMKLAIQNDGAHALVLGCTGMMGVASGLHERLVKEGYDVPVLDPAFCAVKMLESLVQMGVRQSRLTYMPPRKKLRLKV